MNKTPIALCLAGLLMSVAPAQAAVSPEQLEAQLNALSQQLEALKNEVRDLKAQNAALSAQQAASAAALSAQQQAVAAAPATAVPDSTGRPQANASVVATVPTLLEHATLSGYGEINYNRYDHEASRSEADLRRAVIGVGYRFSEDTRFVSEFELEHTVASSSDNGEIEVEQFYIDHRLNSWAAVKAGLILIPSGFLNEVHEPPRYYGVERNFVETAIIPSTEREGGIALHGSVFDGWNYDVGLTTSFNLAAWDFNSSEGRESPLGAIHQELSLARAADFAEYAALNYNGLPGLTVGASVFEGGIGQKQPGFQAQDSRFLLWETHARWTPGRWNLQALYAHGSISNTQAVNLANIGSATPIPEAFHGWYLQAAYKLWQHGGYALHPFVRYERFNTADGYAAQPAGLGLAGAQTETVRTYGASFYITPDVVLKADYQDFGVQKNNNRFNLGLGFQFY